MLAAAIAQEFMKTLAPGFALLDCSQTLSRASLARRLHSMVCRRKAVQYGVLVFQGRKIAFRFPILVASGPLLPLRDVNPSFGPSGLAFTRCPAVRDGDDMRCTHPQQDRVAVAI